MRLLLAEDEKELSKTIQKVLQINGWEVDQAFDGEEALTLIASYTYDGVILDVMMPKKDGFEVVKTLRKAGNNVPVLMLTARAETDDKVLGLDLGADDYLTKPFIVKELLARVRALTRRKGEYREECIVGDLKLDKNTYSLRCGENSVKLTNTEYRLTEYLMRNQDVLLSTEKILTNIWDYGTDIEINVVWVYISALRKKMEKIGSQYTIRTERGTGYRLEKK